MTPACSERPGVVGIDAAKLEAAKRVGAAVAHAKVEGDARRRAGKEALLPRERARERGQRITSTVAPGVESGLLAGLVALFKFDLAGTRNHAGTGTGGGEVSQVVGGVRGKPKSVVADQLRNWRLTRKHVLDDNHLAQSTLKNRNFLDFAVEVFAIAPTANRDPIRGGRIANARRGGVEDRPPIQVAGEGVGGPDHGDMIPTFEIGSLDESVRIGAGGSARGKLEVARIDVEADLIGVRGAFITGATIGEDRHILSEVGTGGNGQLEPARDGQRIGGGIPTKAATVINLDAGVAREGGGTGGEGEEEAGQNRERYAPAGAPISQDA